MWHAPLVEGEYGPWYKDDGTPVHKDDGAPRTLLRTARTELVDARARSAAGRSRHGCRANQRRNARRGGGGGGGRDRAALSDSEASEEEAAVEAAEVAQHAASKRRRARLCHAARARPLRLAACRHALRSAARCARCTSMSALLRRPRGRAGQQDDWHRAHYRQRDAASAIGGGGRGGGGRGGRRPPRRRCPSTAMRRGRRARGRATELRAAWRRRDSARRLQHQPKLSKPTETA